MADDKDPIAEPIVLPDGYGTPKCTLDWPVVRELLETSMRYWLVTTRPDGRMHVVPVDGMWLDDVWYHGGAADTVHLRNLQENPAAVMHLEDAWRAVVVEGTNELVKPPKKLASRLAKAANAKYGYGATAAGYEKDGIWSMTPGRAMAWTTFPEDATRFRFD